MGVRVRARVRVWLDPNPTSSVSRDVSAPGRIRVRVWTRLGLEGRVGNRLELGLGVKGDSRARVELGLGLGVKGKLMGIFRTCCRPKLASTGVGQPGERAGVSLYAGDRTPRPVAPSPV